MRSELTPANLEIQNQKPAFGRKTILFKLFSSKFKETPLKLTSTCDSFRYPYEI